MKKYRLPKEFAEKWIAALRSGEYKQCNKQLSKIREYGDSYCCLGVACDISGYEFNGNNSLASFPYDVIGGMPLLPQELLTKDDFNSDKDFDEQETLPAKFAYMNDVLGWTFQQIADWIIENVELY